MGPHWAAAPAGFLQGEGRGCRQACAGVCVGVCAHTCVCVHVCTMSLHCVFPPHLRQEGFLSETVYLPNCHVFAKTKTAKETSTFGGGARARGAASGGPDSLSFSVARSRQMVSRRHLFPLWPFAMCLLRNSSFCINNKVLRLYFLK